IVEADASFTINPGVVCAILTADCLPVFVSKKDGSMVGIAHAGWKGLISGVIENLIL
ncbi:laccase domain-containing protein, partial [Candidatus Pseudothioglobus singularis]|uniref:laccase domain-containing protein n=1 Tax=Candidatus Pseudothioglobus singularis TaxID=1427364 RepID=UPI003D9C0A0F